MSDIILLPGDPGFNQTLLLSRPPGWQQVAAKNGNGAAMVEDSSTGIMKPVDEKGLEEYMYGGEYDEAEQKSQILVPIGYEYEED